MNLKYLIFCTAIMLALGLLPPGGMTAAGDAETMGRATFVVR